MRYYYQKLSQLHMENLISKLIVFNKANQDPFFFRNEEGRAMCICHGVQRLKGANFIYNLKASEIRRYFINQEYLTEQETLYFISCFSGGILLDDSKCKFEYLTRYPIGFDIEGNYDGNYEFVIYLFDTDEDLEEILAMPAYKDMSIAAFKID